MRGSETLKINKNFQLSSAELLLTVLVLHEVTKLIVPISEQSMVRLGGLMASERPGDLVEI